MTAGKFYQESFMAAKELGTRAVLLIGKDERNRPIGQVPESILIENYARIRCCFRDVLLSCIKEVCVPPPRCSEL